MHKKVRRKEQAVEEGGCACRRSAGREGGRMSKQKAKRKVVVGCKEREYVNRSLESGMYKR